MLLTILIGVLNPRYQNIRFSNSPIFCHHGTLLFKVATKSGMSKLLAFCVFNLDALEAVALLSGSPSIPRAWPGRWAPARHKAKTSGGVFQIVRLPCCISRRPFRLGPLRKFCVSSSVAPGTVMRSTGTLRSPRARPSVGWSPTGRNGESSRAVF